MSMFYATKDDEGNVTIHFDRSLLAGFEGTYISHSLEEVMHDDIRGWKTLLGLTDKNYKKKIHSLIRRSK